ncbi:MAG TPA: acyl-CoA desaturase [Acidimicrobiales bacterium]|nr:acyl-CoA desaturase [Acidimicrobiales bacterium]
MAISDVGTFAHLSDADVAALGREFDAIRRDIEEARGADDAAYIGWIISAQRRLMVAARLSLFASAFPPAWIAGTAMLAAGKILENMEIGHNVMHGQWDWMNDPEIHSGTWEWDNTCPAEQWKHSHNFVHHTFTNVIGKDNDVGYGILRVTRDQKWHPVNLGQPVYNALLALLFEWGVAVHDLDIVAIRKREKDPLELKRQLKGIWQKVRRQVGKDYIIFPALSGPNFLTTLSANVTANLVRNLWSYMIIFCGHFPDGAEKFTEEELENESKPEWYLRQLLGSANFEGSRFLHVMSGSLGYQIEHHLFPDLPSNRYPEIAERVRALCEKYDLPYTTGPLYRQYGQVLRTIFRLSLPTKSVGPSPEFPKPRRATPEELRNHSGPQAPQAAVA